MATIGFIGSGQMARALARGFVAAGKATPPIIVAGDVAAEAREAMAREIGCRCFADNPPVVAEADILILAIKPQSAAAALAEIAPALATRKPLVVSIVTGLTIARMASTLGKEQRLVRVMPNTPCLVGESASAYCIGGGASDGDAAIVEDLLNAVGRAFRVPESQLDAVTGLSGSGPAYVYQIIEALSDGGVRVGLPRELATQLAAQTVLGAAKMVLETRQHPGQLKDAVTSPGGTTIAGLAVLESRALRSALIDAVFAATARATELGKG